MLSPLRLCAVAFHGLGDLRSAATESGEARNSVLRTAFGPRPYLAIVGIALLAGLLGALVDRVFFGGPSINVPSVTGLTIQWTVLFGAVTFAILLRRVVFQKPPPANRDFDFLFSSLWIACAVIVTVAGVTGQIRVPLDAAHDVDPLLLVVEILEAAAIFTVAVAALCYRKQWFGAAFDVVVRLIVFKFMIWLAVLLMVEIGIVGKIVGGIAHAVTGWRMPADIKEIIDRLSYAGLVSAAYLAIIGGTWTVCKQTFGDLVKTGDVDILAALQELINAKEDKAKEDKEKSDEDPTRVKEP